MGAQQPKVLHQAGKSLRRGGNKWWQDYTLSLILRACRKGAQPLDFHYHDGPHQNCPARTLGYFSTRQPSPVYGAVVEETEPYSNMLCTWDQLLQSVYSLKIAKHISFSDSLLPFLRQDLLLSLQNGTFGSTEELALRNTVWDWGDTGLILPDHLELGSYLVYLVSIQFLHWKSAQNWDIIRLLHER